MNRKPYLEFIIYFNGSSGMQPEIALIASLIPHLGTNSKTIFDINIHFTNVAAGHVIPEV